MLNPNINRGRRMRPEDSVSKRFLKQLHAWAMSKSTNYPISSYWSDPSVRYTDEIHELLNEVEDTHDEVGVNDFPSCCGMVLIENLVTSSIQEQILLILSGLMSLNVNQVVFTDNLKSSRWKEAKVVSYQGPITFNPGHKSHVQVYMFTWACMPELVKYLPKAEYNKFFK